MTDLAALDATGHAALVQHGEATPTELVEAAIGRVEAGRELNAVISERFDAARAEAAAVAADGPLAGVPVLLKELGAALAGTPARMGCRALRDNVAAQTGVLVRRLQDAGAIVLGTTNTPEWGNHCTTEPVLTGPTVNPLDPGRSPGGSSGGSAVAVATGQVPLASGGDGTGSIRVPAACCGVVGLKPRRGRTTMAPGGGHGLEGLVNEHGLTRSVRDTALLLDVIGGPVLGDPYGAPPPARPFAAETHEQHVGPVRVALALDPPLGGTLDAGHRAATEAAAAALAGLGHAVDTAWRPAGASADARRADVGRLGVDADAIAEAVAVLHGVSNLELVALATEVLGRPPAEDELEPSSWQMAREGLAISGATYAGAIATLHAQTRRFVAALGEAEVLLVPALLEPVGLGVVNQPRASVADFFRVEFAVTGWTVLANVSGWAALVLPFGSDAAGRPVGVQLMAPDEAVLLRLGAQLERA